MESGRRCKHKTTMDGLKGGILQGPPSCSVCLEVVNDASERSIAKLTCGHQFHLDCIGSAFNAKGSMQCPNCRRIEHGQWLYANGGRQREDPFFEDIIIEEEYDLFAGVPEFLFPHEYLVGHVQWCPYQGSYAQLSLSLGGDADHHLQAHPELVVNVVVGENVESGDSFHPCPFVLAQTPALVARVPSAEENVRVQESGARPHQGARPQRQFPSSRGGQWGGGYQQLPAAFSPIGVAGHVGPPEGSRWPYFENRSAVHAPTQARYHGRRPPHTSVPSVDNHHHPQASQFSSGSWDYAGQFAVQNANRESEPRFNAPFTQR